MKLRCGQTRWAIPAAAAALWLLLPAASRALPQSAPTVEHVAHKAKTDQTGTNQVRASKIVAAAIQALGGARWLHLRTERTEGRTALFFKGAPTGEIQDVTVTTKLPDRQRFDFGKKDKVVHIYEVGHAWEVTYKGVRNLSGPKVDAYRRWRKHSLGRALRDWYGKPGSILLYDGPSMVERHTADKITLIGPAHQSITLEIGTESHLPLRLSFQWRDPRFHDKSTGAVEYDNYEHIDGIAIPFTVTRTVNGATVSERFRSNVEFNPRLPKDWFDPTAEAARLK